MGSASRSGESAKLPVTGRCRRGTVMSQHCLQSSRGAGHNWAVPEIKIIGVCSPLTPPSVIPRRVIWHFRGLICHRVPLRGEFLPFLFGGWIGGVSGAFLAANRFQVIFLGQGKLGNALICGHSAAPQKRRERKALSHR